MPWKTRLLVVGVLSVALPVLAQSLGDVARREQEKKAEEAMANKDSAGNIAAAQAELSAALAQLEAIRKFRNRAG